MQFLEYFTMLCPDAFLLSLHQNCKPNLLRHVHMATFLDNFNGVVYIPDYDWVPLDTLQLYMDCRFWPPWLWQFVSGSVGSFYLAIFIVFA